MTDTVRAFQQDRRTPRSTRAAVLLAVSLIAIRLIAAIVCATCFTELETPLQRSFHIHSGNDHDPCHRGQASPTPLVNWACWVNQDDDAYVLPEVLRLPVIVSVLIPLVLFDVSYRGRPLISSTGRSPPFVTHA